MKKLLLPFLLLPAICLAQYPNIKLENRQITFERKYTVDSLSASAIKTLLSTKLPTVKAFTDFYQSDEVMTGKLKDGYINFQAYGGKAMTTATFIQNPYDASVSVIWKDSAYKVSVTNIVFKSSTFGRIELESPATRKNATQFDQGKMAEKCLTYIDKYFSDLFTFSTNKNQW